MLLLGNDIVDLNETGVRGKFNHTRFVSRVFTESEQVLIRKSDNPDVALWSIWAAKESAYKVISKLRGTPVFAHKKFGTVQKRETVGGSPQEQKIVIEFQGDRLQVEVNACANYVAAVGAFSSNDDNVMSTIRSGIAVMTAETRRQQPGRPEIIFTAEERASITRPESAQVRILCKNAIAKQLGIAAARLQIIRPFRAGKSQPPYVLIDEKRCDVDVSLAHHGEWLAWCFSAPTPSAANPS